MKIDNDSKDLVQVYAKMFMMILKIIMASFPLMFIPQKCDDTPCSLTDKFFAWKYFHIMNLLTSVSFMNIYFWQSKRESYLITHFDENDEKSENSLNNEIKEYPLIEKKVKFLNSILDKSNTVSIIVYVCNTMFSSVLIFMYRYLDSTTITVTLTNSLLVYGKLIQIRGCFTGDDIAQSSVFIRQRVYNCIDEDKKLIDVEI